MTVEELIDKLQKYPMDAEIYKEYWEEAEDYSWNSSYVTRQVDEARLDNAHQDTRWSEKKIIVIIS